MHRFTQGDLGDDALDELRERVTETDDRFVELRREETFSMRFYRVTDGTEGPHRPIGGDGVYSVVSGQARFRRGDETHQVEAGDVLHVERGDDHRFVDVETPLEALVVVSPPDTTVAGV
ncbi:cupin domain-containing protein [Haloarchaeobius sp. HRN-SO-5]|uniref:cupin domain-containing protein n=1 Tax=Haloarchaeobius sp. HRN-SO-5 TaxID=3446118 RepID=UPI003EB95613